MSPIGAGWEEWGSTVPNPNRLGDPGEYAILAAQIVENDYLKRNDHPPGRSAETLNSSNRSPKPAVKSLPERSGVRVDQDGARLGESPVA
jgi:hypothetical protein